MLSEHLGQVVQLGLFGLYQRQEQLRQLHRLGLSLPLIKQRRTDLILLADLADAQVGMTALFDNLKFRVG